MKRYIKPVSVVVNMASEPVMQVASMSLFQDPITAEQIRAKRRTDDWEDDLDEDF